MSEVNVLNVVTVDMGTLRNVVKSVVTADMESSDTNVGFAIQA